MKDTNIRARARGPRRNWSEAEDAKLIVLLKQVPTPTSSAIGLQLARASSSVLKRAGELGYRFHRKKLRAYTPETLSFIATRLKESASYQEIALELGISVTRVHYLVKQHGLSPRRLLTWTNERDAVLLRLIEQNAPLTTIISHLHTTKYEMIERLKCIVPSPTGAVQRFIAGDAVHEIIMSKVASSKMRCRKMGLEFSIDEPFVRNLFTQQQGRCYYTGLPMTFQRHDPHILSIERKDSMAGYTPDNVVLCIWDINRMKQDMTMDRFIELCSIIAHKWAHSKSLPVESLAA